MVGGLGIIKERNGLRRFLAEDFGDDILKLNIQELASPMEGEDDGVSVSALVAAITGGEFAGNDSGAKSAFGSVVGVGDGVIILNKGISVTFFGV